MKTYLVLHTPQFDSEDCTPIIFLAETLGDCLTQLWNSANFEKKKVSDSLMLKDDFTIIDEDESDEYLHVGSLLGMSDGEILDSIDPYMHNGDGNDYFRIYIVDPTNIKEPLNFLL